MHGLDLISLLFVIFVLLLLFLLLREFWCWYWKQNKIVSLLEKINAKLDVQAVSKPIEEVTIPITNTDHGKWRPK